MRKGQEKILEKAIKAGFSERKLEYLKREDRPIDFYKEAYYFLGKYTDEELVDLSFFDRIYDFLNSFEYDISVSYCIYPNKPDITLLQQILSYATDIYTKKNMLLLASYQSLNMKEIIDLLSIYHGPKLNNLFQLYVSKFTPNMKDNWPLFLQYLREPELDSKFIENAIALNIPYEYAKQYNFLIDKMPEYAYETRFSWLSQICPLNDNTSASFIFVNQKEEILEKAQEIFNLDKKFSHIVLDVPSEYIKVNYRNLTLNITLANSKSTAFTKSNDVYLDNFYNNEKLVCFSNGMWYRETTKKLIPLTLRYLFNLLKKYPFLSEKIIPLIMQQAYTNKHFAWKDVFTIYQLDAYGKAIPPIHVSKFNKAVCLNDVFQEYYADGKLYDWNKKNISTGYLFLKAIKKIKKQDINILRNFTQHYHNDYEVLNCYDEEGLIKTYFCKKIDIDNENDLILIKDYIQMSIALKQKINLKFRSINKIKEAHNDLSILYAKKNVGKVEIPKDSKFNQLEKVLPKNFKRIKSSKAIKLEGDWMHHCVASYWEKVNRDTCAIFHLTYNNEEYTIEFGMERGQYTIWQIQSRCDRGCPSYVREYVQNYINDINQFLHISGTVPA